MMKNIILFIVIFLIAVLCTACSLDSAKTSYVVSIKVTLKDNNVMDMKFILYFNDIKGVRDIKKNEKQFKHAVVMVMREHNEDAFSKAKVISALKSIAKQVLHEKVIRIKMSRYSIS